MGDDDDVGFDALWAPTCKQALIVGLGLVTLQQVRVQARKTFSRLKGRRDREGRRGVHRDKR